MKKLRIVAPVLVILALVITAFAAATPVMADSQPPGANAAGVSLSLLILDMDDQFLGEEVEIGQELQFMLGLSLPTAAPGVTYVNFELGTLALRVGTQEWQEVAGYPGTPIQEIPVVSAGDPFWVMAPFTYVVQEGDIGIITPTINFEAAYGKTTAHPDGVNGWYLWSTPLNTANASTSRPMTVLYEDLEITKTVDTSFERTHAWDIRKWVETENEQLWNDTDIPKIWLYEGGSGDETATWHVCVDYLGYTDSEFVVSGEITITNTGDLPAVIVDVVDELCGVEIVVTWPIGFGPGDTLAVDDSITLTYNVDVPAMLIDCMNEVWVETERDDYYGFADVVWDEEPNAEHLDVVNIEDLSDYFGLVELGELDAADFEPGDEHCFTYDHFFFNGDPDWPNPGPHFINNTAIIVETEQSASAVLVINVPEEELFVSKTIETSFKRTHEWDITKEVETVNGHLWNDTDIPKIWLYEGGSGDETATWHVCVEYLGYQDHDFNVSGTITIENTGTQDAVIVDVVDELCDVEIVVTWPGDFSPGDILAVGESITLTYDVDVDSMLDDCYNVVTVTTEVRTYSYQRAIPEWGDPDEEFLKVINVEDLSEYFGLVELGELDAADFEPGDEHCFTYDHFFSRAVEEYEPNGPYFVNNTAIIVETEQSASAMLVINVPDEDLEVTKTVETSFKRTHAWDIDKYVTTEYGETIDDGIAKIWLYRDGSGDETATWHVCVEYLGYEDHDFVVSGEITIENVGGQDAVIVSVEDYLCGDPIAVEWPVDFGPGDTLAVGDSITLTYSVVVNEMVECGNYVNVFTEVDEYSSWPPVAVTWGEPDEEYYDVVNIEDDSDLFGGVWLGMLDAADLDEGDIVCFDYDQFFAWTDYDAPGPYTYNNTATIVETNQSASAILVVNWEEDERCWADETAWAYGGEDSANPIWDFVNSNNWGWTNNITEGSYEWPIYAGAGQNNIENGTLVGTLYVEYDDGCVTVTYQLYPSVDGDVYYLGETHLWVGDDVLPKVPRGRSGWAYTNAPGQFPYGEYIGFEQDDPDTWETMWTWSSCDFDIEFDGPIYIAAHSVVWMEVECDPMVGTYM